MKTESEESGQQALGVSPIRSQWPQQGASPIQQLPSQSSNLAPQLSSQGARSTHPQWSQGLSTHPQWSQGSSTHPQWSHDPSTHLKWSKGPRTHLQWSLDPSTHPQWSQGPSTHLQWSQGPSTHPQWSHGVSPTQPQQSSKGTRSYPQVLRQRANPTHLQDDRRKKPMGFQPKNPQTTSPGQEAQGTSTRQQTQGTSVGQQQTQGTSIRQHHTQAISARQHVQGTRNKDQTLGTSAGQQEAQDTSNGQQARGTRTGQQQPQSTSTRQEGKCTSTRQKQPQLALAEIYWRQSTREWYPNLHRQTYFIPPIYFKRVPYDVQTVAGQSVLIPQEASDQPHQMPVVFNPSGPPPQVPAAPLASRVWPDQPVLPGLLPVVYDMDVRDDSAMQKVRHYIRNLAEREILVMLVLSQLEFRKYLDNQVDPISAAAIRLLPRAVIESPSHHGEFDVLMISEKYGLIVGEVKAVGADPRMILDIDIAVVKRVEKTLKQLNKAEAALRSLVSDLASVRITKTLMLPNITSTQLLHALSTHHRVQQALCECVGVDVTDPAAAVARCLCSDSLTSSKWWQKAVTDNGPDINMTPDLYEILVARFGGPATTIEVPTVTTPRRTVPLRTLSEAVALTGLTMSMLTLYPEQVELLNRPGLPRVFLWGPPGTGKTVILVIKGMQWGHQGKDVHLLSSHRHSRASTLLIEGQMRHSLGAGSVLSSTPTSISTTVPTSTPTSGSLVSTHFYDFANKGDVEAAVEELASAACNGELFVIADETSSHPCGKSSDRFAEFCTHLVARVPALHLWAAAVECEFTPACLCVETVTTPVRCPPAVVRMVQKSRLCDGRRVPRYSSYPAPAPTDGLAVREIRHWEDRDCATPSPGHTGNKPQDCESCADHIAHLMDELRVGQPDHGLQYRDTIILCCKPRDNQPVVTRLRAGGLPVQVVTSDGDEAAIRDVALAVHDTVIVTDCYVASGLERRVVVVMGMGKMFADYETLYAMSRCTSLLVCACEPLMFDDDDDDDVW